MASGGGGQTINEKSGLASWSMVSHDPEAIWDRLDTGARRDVILMLVLVFKGMGMGMGVEHGNVLSLHFTFSPNIQQLSLSIQYTPSRIFHNHKENRKTGKNSRVATHHPLLNHVTPLTSNA